MNATKSEVERYLQHLEKKFREAERRERFHSVYLSSQNPVNTQQSSAIERRRPPTANEQQDNLFAKVTKSLSSGPTKASFMKGDAVWTQMEENAENFLKEMRPFM